MDSQGKRRGPPEQVPPEGTLARELHDLRVRMGEARGARIPRREMAALISQHQAAADPYHCSVPMITYWETDQQRITELIAERYGRVFRLVPLLEWEPVAKGARVPRPGQAVPVSDRTGLAPTAHAQEGSWGRALSELREANGVLRVEMARRLGLGQSAVTRWEGGARPVPTGMVERYAEEFGVRPRIRWVPSVGADQTAATGAVTSNGGGRRRGQRRRPRQPGRR
jgi:hypothetical protein